MGKNKLLDSADKTQAEIIINITTFAVNSVIPAEAGIQNRLNVIDSCFRRNNSIKKYLKKIFYVTSILILEFLMSCAFPRIIVLDDPLSPEEHLNLGVTYEKKGELDNALKEYKEASKKLPAAYRYIGNIYFQKDEFDMAESYYKKAISKNPKNADAHNNLAWLYFIEKKNLDEAEGLALKAIELNPAKKDIYQDTLEKIRGLKSFK